MEQPALSKNKRVLIISPYFPPTNAADMQRVRMSLPFYEDFGWEAEVVTVDKSFTDMAVDELLLKSIPPHIPIHYVRALSKSWTSKIGLGSIAIRSLPFYRTKVNALLRKKKFDLIYFSTTQFPVCILGHYWKQKFRIPYVIDIQDLWHSDYYEDKPRNQRPPKYWFSYRLNKYLEPIAMRSVSGLIAVSEAYLVSLGQLYPNIGKIPRQTITFGAFKKDFEIAEANTPVCPSILVKKEGRVNIVYIGRGGADMAEAISHLFTAFRQGLQTDTYLFSQLHFYFIGTSYAATGKGTATVAPIAAALGVSEYVTEITDRLPFYQTLNTLQDADGLFIPGSNDPQYTASKIYPYVLTGKPLLAIFHPDSSVITFLKNCGVGTILSFHNDVETINYTIRDFLKNVVNKTYEATEPNKQVMEGASAYTMTKHQCELFELALKANK